MVDTLKTLPNKERIKKALRFYEQCPDGQYDHEVVCPILEHYLEIESLTAQLEEAKKALEYYANDKNHEMNNIIQESSGVLVQIDNIGFDCGRVAKAALNKLTKVIA